MVKVGGDNVSPKPTTTFVVAVVRPYACAVMVAVPAAMPFSLGWEFGVVEPVWKRRFWVESAATEVSLLVRLTNVMSVAGLASITWNTGLSPGATIMPEGSRISTPAFTVIEAVALPRLAALAVIVAVPGVTPVTGTGAVVVFCG